MIYLLAFFSSIIVAVSQVLLKKGANIFSNEILWRQYINAYVIISYLLFGVVTIVNVHIFSILPLKVISIMIAFTYILVVFLSKYILKEDMSKKIIIGLGLTLIGMVLYGLGI